MVRKKKSLLPLSRQGQNQLSNAPVAVGTLRFTQIQGKPKTAKNNFPAAKRKFATLGFPEILPQSAQQRSSRTKL